MPFNVLQCLFAGLFEKSKIIKYFKLSIIKIEFLYFILFVQ